ncbi:hypothetical protein C0Q70_14255 [Pomacea canaliculata]|uniref:Uncharacterized protein n=1 Tax=Pomacea canaliculata TaxID=400727 RepID=A0A2T7NZI7_POMCA|nr:hypothetical protein C0Q70_14255 [Pomacea canaliculata]
MGLRDKEPVGLAIGAQVHFFPAPIGQRCPHTCRCSPFRPGFEGQLECSIGQRSKIVSPWCCCCCLPASTQNSER